MVSSGDDDDDQGNDGVNMKQQHKYENKFWVVNRGITHKLELMILFRQL